MHNLLKGFTCITIKRLNVSLFHYNGIIVRWGNYGTKTLTSVDSIHYVPEVKTLYG